MTRDVLARTRSREVSQVRFKLGDYEFREPDYRQILRWSEQLVWLAKAAPENLLPEHLLEVLQERVKHEEYRLTVEDGAITTLVWDIPWLMQPPPSTWEAGLVIEELCIRGVWPRKEPSLRPALPRLRVLELQTPKGCRGSLRTLDLSLVPGLVRLRCGVNELTELDLSGVRGLTELYCNSNRLTELDLSAVPQLTQLYCDGNRLTELDLSGVPHLTELGCGNNQLTELDLSAVPGLTELVCNNNQLTKLDLSAVPNLELLGCFENQLTELDLSAVRNLWMLACWENQLTELDLYGVPGLIELYCNNNRLTELDLSGVPHLTEVGCENNQLTELDLSAVPNLRKLSCDSGVRIKNAPRGLELVGGTIVGDADESPVVEWDDWGDLPF